ncbi:MAG: SipW-dependent-type signal peptide-containing protein [Clostridia bacterium]|nr:SipW-dependent-type signal peptide-containing protein [Clostridia bacterium]
MKKKLIAISLAVAILAVTAIGVSIAYFTDTDNETNTFTMGNVIIDLIEQQRDEEGTALETFEQDKFLVPIVGSAQDPADANGLPTAANYVDKVVTVENTGSLDAYVRAYFAIPAVLDNTTDAGLNILHFNFGTRPAEADDNDQNNDGWVSTGANDRWIWQNADGSWKSFDTTIDGILYNVYYADYYQTLAPEATTERFVNGVYLDANVINIGQNADGTSFITIKRPGATTETVVQLGFDIGDGVSCPVFAIACQAAGFATAEEAFTASFGANYNPWA